VSPGGPARIVIIGAGHAGGWAAKTLRDEGFTGEITLIGDEPHPPHARPPLSKAVLSGAAEPPVTHLFKPALFHGLRIDWRASAVAVAIDRERQEVRLRDGETVPYDRLLICTGGRARMLDVTGAQEAGVRTLRSIDDALMLRGALLPGRTLLVIGGGWIGLEVAATARKLGVDVHVVEALPRLCARVLPPALSEVLHALHERNGVAISCGMTVTRLQRQPDGRVLAVGDAVEIRGPVGGWFVWRQAEPAPVLLVAGGSGIVPLMAMVRARRAANSRVPFRLIYSARSERDVFYADELRRRIRDDQGLDVTYVYTRQTPEGWPTPAHRIGVADVNTHGWPPDLEPFSFVCGPTGFVETVADVLVALGHDSRRVKTERFGPTGG
jgi:thioredoxin reductase